MGMEKSRQLCGRKRGPGPWPLAFRGMVGGGGCAGSGGRSEGLRINSASAGLPPRPADSFVSPQALGLAGLVGEPEGEEEEEGEGPLCPETRFLRLSDGALLLRVLGIM